MLEALATSTIVVTTGIKPSSNIGSALVSAPHDWSSVLGLYLQTYTSAYLFDTLVSGLWREDSYNVFFNSSIDVRGEMKLKNITITSLDIQGVFFNWASPEFAKCWPVSN